MIWYISLGIVIMLTMLSTLWQITSAYAATQFYFHVSNILLGEDVKFVITNTDTGHYQVSRTHLVPYLSNTVTIDSLGGFPPGTNVKGCMTNFDSGQTSCDSNVVEAGGVDFYVSAR
jgi:hypothetical protein